MAAPYVVEPLGRTHDRAAFSCGVEALDRYLQQQVSQEVKRDVAQVFVLTEPESATIIGYYTLSTTSIEPTGLPTDMVRRLPRYPALPALLIGRLAVDQRYRQQGFGQRLLLSALRRCLQLRPTVGFIAVVVDAKDEPAAAFYEKYDFIRMIANHRRLFLPTQTIAELFTNETE